MMTVASFRRLPRGAAGRQPGDPVFLRCCCREHRAFSMEVGLFSIMSRTLQFSTYTPALILLPTKVCGFSTKRSTCSTVDSVKDQALCGPRGRSVVYVWRRILSDARLAAGLVEDDDAVLGRLLHLRDEDGRLGLALDVERHELLERVCAGD